MVGEADSPIGAGGASHAYGGQGGDEFPPRPYKLPSSGIHYPNHDGTVMIRPTRGDEEEMLAGASEADVRTRLATYRALVERCTDFRGLRMMDLTVPDWTALMFNFFAISSGDDRIKLTPVHDVCGQGQPQVLPLTGLRFVRLALAQPGLEANWPLRNKSPEELDSLLATMREMEAGAAADSGAVVTRVLAEKDAREPYLVTVGNTQVSWRLLRLSDLIKAEEFVATLAERQPGNAVNVNPDGPLHTFLLAQQIVMVNGETMTPLKAATWVRRRYSPDLRAIRRDIGAREYGYDLTPKFKCARCQTSFRQRLPIDTNFFRDADDD